MSRAALLAMNYQLAHLNRMPGDYLPHAARALGTARALGIPVAGAGFWYRAARYRW